MFNKYADNNWSRNNYELDKKKDSKLKHRKKLVILLLDIIYWNYYVIGHVLWDKTVVDKLIYTPIDYKQNYPFRRLKLLVEKSGYYSFETNNWRFVNGIQSF